MILLSNIRHMTNHSVYMHQIHTHMQKLWFKINVHVLKQGRIKIKQIDLYIASQGFATQHTL